jgi:hypothetical protein
MWTIAGLLPASRIADESDVRPPSAGGGQAGGQHRYSPGGGLPVGGDRWVSRTSTRS